MLFRPFLPRPSLVPHPWKYQTTATTRLNFGVAYDTSMFDDQINASLTMPSGATWRFGTGLQQLNERDSFAITFESLMSDDATVPAPAFLPAGMTVRK